MSITTVIWISIVGAMALTTLVYAMIFIADWFMTRLTLWYCRRKKIIIDEEYHIAGNNWTVCVIDRSGPGSKYATHEIVENTECRGIYFMSKLEARIHGANEARAYLKKKA